MLIIIFLLISLGHFTTNVYLPSLPAIANYFKVGTSIVQLTVSLYLIGMSLSPIIFGPLSDALGRKKIVLVGLVLGSIATLFCIFAFNIYFLIAGRILQGIAVGAIVVCARTMIPDLYQGRDMAKKITCVTMSMPIMLAISPAVGGYIQEYLQWQAVFLAVLFFFCVFLLMMPNIKETIKNKTTLDFNFTNPLSIVKPYKALITNLPFMLYGMYSVIPLVGMFAYLTISPFLFQEVLGLSPSEYGILSLYIGAGLLVSGYINARLIDVFSLNTLLYIGALVVFTAGVGLLLITHLEIKMVAIILLPIIIYYTCHTFGVANATAQALMQLDGAYGTARALLTACQFLAGAFGSLVFSWLPVIDGFYLAWCFIASGASMFVCVVLVKRTSNSSIMVNALEYAND